MNLTQHIPTPEAVTAFADHLARSPLFQDEALAADRSQCRIARRDAHRDAGAARRGRLTWP